MVNFVKKYKVKTRNIILSAFMLMSFSCASLSLQKENVQFDKNQSIDSTLVAEKDYVAFIKPYKQKLDAEMNRVITYTPIDLTKDGFKCTLCNLTADMTLEYINKHFKNDPNLQGDAVVVNYGGLRRAFNKGDLTIGNVYELMPFENEMYLVTLPGDAMQEMFDYLVNFNVGHPIANMKINTLKDISIAGQKFDPNKSYKIITTDYLYNGGDKMFFFSKAKDAKVLNLKMRDLLLEEFQKTDTLSVDTIQRIIR